MPHLNLDPFALNKPGGPIQAQSLDPFALNKPGSPEKARSLDPFVLNTPGGPRMAQNLDPFTLNKPGGLTKTWSLDPLALSRPGWPIHKPFVSNKPKRQNKSKTYVVGSHDIFVYLTYSLPLGNLLKKPQGYPCTIPRRHPCFPRQSTGNPSAVSNRGNPSGIARRLLGNLSAIPWQFLEAIPRESQSACSEISR